MCIITFANKKRTTLNVENNMRSHILSKRLPKKPVSAPCIKWKLDVVEVKGGVRLVKETAKVGGVKCVLGIN